jgi:hypothetical protein
MGRQMKRRIRRGKESGAESPCERCGLEYAARCGLEELSRASGSDAWLKATVKYISKQKGVKK